MPKQFQIVFGGKVDREKRKLARELRRNMTPQEKALWERLRDNRLCGLHFRRQQVIEGFIVDFYHHASGLAIEADGDIHDAQCDYDSERDMVLAARGIRVLRIRNDEIDRCIEEVLQLIFRACQEGLLT